jgi:uncharacterized protein with PIN domain
MLGRLGRYLRAAGHDTEIAAAGMDRDLLARARREQRIFLTCDRGIADHKAAEGVALILPQGSLEEMAAALASRIAIDWTALAFTRCLEDNSLLEPATITRRARQGHPVDGPARHCPHCDRLYWTGSHWRRLRHRLEQWQLSAQPPAERYEPAPPPPDR